MQTYDSALRSGAKKSRAEISAESTEKVIYPGIRRWLTDNGWTVFRLSTETGLSYCTIRQILMNRRGFTKSTADRILKVTGLTYEEAFKEEE